MESSEKNTRVAGNDLEPLTLHLWSMQLASIQASCSSSDGLEQVDRCRSLVELTARLLSNLLSNATSRQSSVYLNIPT